LRALLDVFKQKSSFLSEMADSKGESRQFAPATLHFSWISRLINMHSVAFYYYDNKKRGALPSPIAVLCSKQTEHLAILIQAAASAAVEVCVGR
jgi:hypothetical protein